MSSGSRARCVRVYVLATSARSSLPGSVLPLRGRPHRYTPTRQAPDRLMVDAVRQHQPSMLKWVVFTVHGDTAEQAFRAAAGQ